MARTEKTAKNIIFSFIGQGIEYILRFVVRILFVKYLAVEYLGLSGLFSNILSMLCLADLGVAVALNYSLYRPLAEGNKEKIKSLMKLYKNTFRVIGVVIALMGIILLPWYKNFIKEVPAIEHLDIIYLLFVFNTASSYFYSYKRNLIVADQKKYIDSINSIIFSLIRNVAQLFILILTRNYFAYLIVQIICTLLENIRISFIADKNYPYLKEKNVKPLEEEEKKEIIQKTAAMVGHKIGGVVVNATDNVLISKFVGLAVTGIYSNYSLIVTMINSIVSQVMTAATASVGNMVATENEKQSKIVFYRMSFFQYYAYMYSSVCMLCLFQPVIELIFGKDLVMDDLTVGIVVLNFYLSGMRRVLNIYRDATGVYYHDRYKPFFESIINLVVSIVLVNKIGLPGVFIGTIVSTILACFFVEPYIVFKYVFKQSSGEYFLWYFKKAIIVLGIFLVTNGLCSFIVLDLIWEVLVKGIVCIIVPNLLFILIYYKDENYKFYVQLLKSMVGRKVRK